MALHLDWEHDTALTKKHDPHQYQNQDDIIPKSSFWTKKKKKKHNTIFDQLNPERSSVFNSTPRQFLKMKAPALQDLN